MNLKEAATTITAVAAVFALGYTLALRGGYLVDEARADEIAQSKVEQQERALLEFVRETKFNRLRVLNASSSPTPDEQLEAEILRDDIKRITDRLEELK